MFPDFDAITFRNPEFFYLFALLPILLLWYVLRRNKQHADLQMSSLEGFARARPSLRQRLRHLQPVLRMATIAALVIALARPQSSSSGQEITTEGIDIVLCLDVSGSMLAEDFKPNRIEAAKEVAIDFIGGRPNDRVGLVIFSGESFTQCPITTDHDIVINLLDELKTGLLEDGTAIGMGLATSVNRLKDSRAKSKVVILLTDGDNNAGFIAPLTAAEIAQSFNVRVYTIGVGKKGKAPYPVQTPFGKQYQYIEANFDEDMLRKIGSMTQGAYFRATDNKSLEEIYSEIDQLEKTRIEVTEFQSYTEEFFPFALLAGILFVLELLGRYTIFRTLP